MKRTVYSNCSVVLQVPKHPSMGSRPCPLTDTQPLEVRYCMTPDEFTHRSNVSATSPVSILPTLAQELISMPFLMTATSWQTIRSRYRTCDSPTSSSLLSLKAILGANSARFKIGRLAKEGDFGHHLLKTSACKKFLLPLKLISIPRSARLLTSLTSGS